jgi:hypothetical protein
MSDSTSQNNEGPATPVVPAVTVVERFAMVPAVPPPGAIFSLGWLMAQLFDPRRQASEAVRQPPFDADVQLPQVPDLQPTAKLVFLAAELAELMRLFPALAVPSAAVTGETDKLKPVVAAESASLAQAAAAADAAGMADPGNAGNIAPPEPPAPAIDTPPAGAPPAGAAPAGVGGPGAGTGAEFSPAVLLTAVSQLHQAILDEFADAPDRLSAYQLGLSLSDLAWRPCLPENGRPESAATKPSALLGLFSRTQLAAIKSLLSGAGAQLPSSSSAIVSQSLDNWADWLEVNAPKLSATGAADVWSDKGSLVLRALRIQGSVWHSVLIADPEWSVAPSMGAWVQAGSSIARATGMMSMVILRRFWPLVLIALAALGGLLALVIVNLSGAGQVWASLVTVVTVCGAGGLGLGSGVSQAFGGFGYEIWNAAKQDASAWNITWLPAMTATTTERARLSRMGVAAPQIRKHLDLQ